MRTSETGYQHLMVDLGSSECRNYPGEGNDSAILALTDIPWYPPYPRDTLHYHNCMEIGLCQEGCGTLETGGQCYSFDAGALLLSPRGAHHAQHNAGQRVTHWRYIAVDTDRLLGETPASARHVIRQALRGAWSGGVFLLSGDATVHSLKLERGTIATDWCPSVLDPSSVADRFKGVWYLQQALKGSTQFIGGLGLTTMMQLGKWTDGVMEKVNAGISGIYNEDTDVAFWAGGTFEQAIATVRKIIGGENPSDEEWKSLAKFVATHGGDIFLRGYIYALGGVFRGIVYAEGGEFRGKFETSLNGIRIVIDPEDGSLKMLDENDRTAVNISFSNNDGSISAGMMITEYSGDTAWFSTRILGRSITMVNNIGNYGAILLPDQIRFLSGGSELFSLSMVQDYDKGGKKLVITGSNWNETEGLAGTVYVDENGFLKVSKKEPVQPDA